MVDVNRLRTEMRRLRMSQAVLADAIGASPAAIQQILNGKTQQTRLLSKIARALDVTVEWLEGENVNFGKIDKVESNLGDMHVKPFLYFDDETSVTESGAIKTKFVYISSYWADEVFNIDKNEDKIVLVRVRNSEMAPTIMSGDDLAVDQQAMYDGNPDGVWILSYNSRTMIRRISSSKKGYMTCRADNPKYAPFEVAESDVEIRGRIVWQGRSLTP